jgi:hypothetical protein
MTRDGTTLARAFVHAASAKKTVAAFLLFLGVNLLRAPLYADSSAEALCEKLHAGRSKKQDKPLLREKQTRLSGSFWKPTQYPSDARACPNATEGGRMTRMLSLPLPRWT